MGVGLSVWCFSWWNVDIDVSGLVSPPSSPLYFYGYERIPSVAYSAPTTLITDYYADSFGGTLRGMKLGGCQRGRGVYSEGRIGGMVRWAELGGRSAWGATGDNKIWPLPLHE